MLYRKRDPHTKLVQGFSIEVLAMTSCSDEGNPPGLSQLDKDKLLLLQVQAEVRRAF